MRRRGGTGPDEVFDLSLDAAGYTYAAGYTTRVASDRGDGGWVGASRAAPRGPEDAVAFRLTPRGDVAWLATLGGAGGGMAYAVDANPESGDAVVGGFTFGLGGAPATFGSGPAAPVLHSRGSRAGFVSKVRARAAPRVRSRGADAPIANRCLLPGRWCGRRPSAAPTATR